MAVRVCLPSVVFVFSEWKGYFSREGMDLRELHDVAGDWQAFWYPGLARLLVIPSHLHPSHL